MTSVARPRARVRAEPQFKAVHAGYALFVFAAALLALGFILPTFRVGSVQIVGNGLPTREIAAAAGVTGRSIFTIRGSQIVANVERIPNVLVVGVDVSLPNVVVIRATLRQPVFAWRQGKSLYQVDAYGRLISRVAATRLPVVYNQTKQPVGLGGYVESAVAEAVPYIRRTLPEAGVRSLLLESNRGLVLHSDQGWAAVLGRPTGRMLVTRIATLKAFLTAIAHHGQHLRWIDLRSRAPYASFS